MMSPRAAPGHTRRVTRRAVLGAARTALAALVAGCSFPWERPGPAPRSLPWPAPTPPREAQEALRLVVGREGLPALDDAVRRLIGEAAVQVGLRVEVQDLEDFLHPRRAGPAGAGTAQGTRSAETVAHRLLATVQAGVAPDALLLLGRQGQAARFRAMGLVLDASEPMRGAVRRFGALPAVAEVVYVIGGNWLAVPYYQRLVGHWAREDALRSLGLDPEGALDYAALRPLLGGPGGGDTTDADAWCWGVIHAWGGGLADHDGGRVILSSPHTVAALRWLAETLAAPARGVGARPAGAGPAEAAGEEAFLSGTTAYTYNEWGPVAGATASPAGGGAAAVYLRTPAGPAARPRAVGGGAAWFLPRGARQDAVERFLDALREPARQRALWQAGAGFALPAHDGLWDEAGPSGPLAAVPEGQVRRNVQRFRDELTNGGFVSATGNGGPETAASQAIGAARLGARMLRAVLRGRPAEAVVAEAHDLAVQLFRDYGLQGA